MRNAKIKKLFVGGHSGTAARGAARAVLERVQAGATKGGHELGIRLQKGVRQAGAAE